jgi:hypothetical protein
LFPFACPVAFYEGVFQDVCHATRGCHTAILTSTGQLCRAGLA